MATAVHRKDPDPSDEDPEDVRERPLIYRSGGKELRRAVRKLAANKRAIGRLRRELATAFAGGGKVREDLVERILDAKAQAARLREDLERRRTAAA